MLTSPRTGCVLQLTDFGLAREGGGTLGQTLGQTLGGGGTAGGPRGTVAWMAPELLAAPAPGARPARASYRTDVYAWAVMAWQVLAASPQSYPGLNDMQVNNAVLAGRRPDIGSLPAGLPPALLALLASCWAAAPGDRPRSGGELLEALREAAPTPARRPSRPSSHKQVPP